MATLTVRKLDDNTYNRLQSRASDHGISMEEEARRILKQTVAAPQSITQIFNQYFGKKNGINLKLLKRKPHEPIDLTDEK